LIFVQVITTDSCPEKEKLAQTPIIFSEYLIHSNLRLP